MAKDRLLEVERRGRAASMWKSLGKLGAATQAVLGSCYVIIHAWLSSEFWGSL